MTQFDFDLQDRITKIKAINEQYDLDNEAFISFSGGKDSAVLSKVIDLALPNNKIPRVFFNTGIEYKAIVSYVEGLTQKDSRFIVYNSGINIREMLDEKGYPFKSKEFSQKLFTYQRSGKTKIVTDYLGETGNKQKIYQCPDKLKSVFTDEFKLKVSDKCCKELKKKLSERVSKEINRPIVLTGIRKGEGGNRASISGCTVFNEGKLRKFHPLFPVNKDFVNKVIYLYGIKLCELYYPPYNFERTGCKGCPYNMKLQEQLDAMKELMPEEYKQCLLIWNKVYEQYYKYDYRLTSNNLGVI